MGLMLIVGVTWIVLAVSVAVVIGRAIRVADARVVGSSPDRFREADAQVLTLQLPRGRTLV